MPPQHSSRGHLMGRPHVREAFKQTRCLLAQGRADVSVDGTIAIDTLANVGYVGRPVGAQSDAATTVFRAKVDDSVVERVPVKFEKESVNEIVGLEPGDIVPPGDRSQLAP